jgi:hypothetical protein
VNLIHEDWRGKKWKITSQRAVEIACTDAYTGGPNLYAAIRLLAGLVECLHDSGALTDNQVLDLLDSPAIKKED